MATQRNWYPYQDFLDILDTIEEKPIFYLILYLIMN